MFDDQTYGKRHADTYDKAMEQLRLWRDTGTMDKEKYIMLCRPWLAARGWPLAYVCGLAHQLRVARYVCAVAA